MLIRLRYLLRALRAPSVTRDLYSVSSAIYVNGFNVLFSRTKIEFFDEDDDDLSPENAVFVGKRKGSM